MQSPSETQICDRPVFVIGSPRSGTSILAHALAASHEFCTFAETDFFYYLFKRDPGDACWKEIQERPGHRNWLIKFGVDRSEFDVAIGNGLNEMITRRNPGLRWVDQTPSNTLVAGALARMFPGAKFLHALRDGRRVVHSMTHFMRGSSGEPTNAALPVAWANDFREACHTWCVYVRGAFALDALLPGRVVTVVNEELAADPSTVFDTALQELDADASAAPAKFAGTRTINSSFSGEPDLAPWRRWSAAECDIFAEETRTVLDQCAPDLHAKIASWWPEFEHWYAPASLAAIRAVT